jgi:hypothetical protein
MPRASTAVASCSPIFWKFLLFRGAGRSEIFGWDFYVGAQARAVALNIFLDGNTFQNSRSVVKEPVVGDLIVGAELFSIGGLRFGFSLVARTPEFRKQAGLDNFGSFQWRMRLLIGLAMLSQFGTRRPNRGVCFFPCGGLARMERESIT